MLCKNAWCAFKSAAISVGKLYVSKRLYCMVGSDGKRGGMYDVHMIMSPMFVGVLIASVLSCCVGICVYVMSFLMRIATPELRPKDLQMLLYPLIFTLLSSINPRSLNKIISGLMLLISTWNK